MKYIVAGVQVVVLEDETIVAGSVKVHTAEFTFDETWTEYSKIAVFKRGAIVKEQVLIDGKCEIPWEALQARGTLQVGIYGKTEENIRPTLWAPDKTISDGAEQGEESREPTPDLWQQLQRDLKYIAPHIGENGNWYVGDADTGVHAQGDKGDNYVLTKADKAEISEIAANGVLIGKQLVLTPDEWVDDSDAKITSGGLPYKDIRFGFTTTADRKDATVLATKRIYNEWQTITHELTLSADAEALSLYFLGGQNSKFIQPYDIMDVKVYAADDADKKNLFSDDIEEQGWLTNSSSTKRSIATTDGEKFMHVFRQGSNIVKLYSSQQVPLAAGEYVIEFKVRLSPWLYHYVAPFYDAHSEYSISVSPTRTSAGLYKSRGVYCAAFGNFSVIFTCDTIPTSDIVVNSMVYKASGTPGMIFQGGIG